MTANVIPFAVANELLALGRERPGVASLAAREPTHRGPLLSGPGPRIGQAHYQLLRRSAMAFSGVRRRAIVPVAMRYCRGASTSITPGCVAAGCNVSQFSRCTWSARIALACFRFGNAQTATLTCQIAREPMYDSRRECAPLGRYRRMMRALARCGSSRELRN